MIVKPSIAFNDFACTTKVVTARNVKGRNILSSRTQHSKIVTPAQAGKSVLGNASKISDANLYNRLNYWIVQTGGVVLSTPPTLVGVDAPAEADLDLSAEAFQFQLTDMPENVADLRLIIQASAPQSNGISRAYGKAVQIGEAREIVDEMINIKADYEAVHGAVTDAAPKVFLKYFFVNTKTGEKSGEMLASVKLG